TPRACIPPEASRPPRTRSRTPVPAMIRATSARTAGTTMNRTLMSPNVSVTGCAPSRLAGQGSDGRVGVLIGGDVVRGVAQQVGTPDRVAAPVLEHPVTVRMAHERDHAGVVQRPLVERRGADPAHHGGEHPDRGAVADHGDGRI